MMTRLFIALCLAICVAQFPAALAIAAAPATAPTTAPVLAAAQIDSLLARLSDDDFRVRQAAVERLVMLGQDARPIVVELLARARQTEVRAGLQVALAQIDENRVSGASIVSLHVKEAAPREVFEQLSRQCYAELRPNPENLWETGGLQTVTLDVDHQPFWAVMRQVMDQTHTELQSFRDGLRIARSNKGATGPAIIHGPFLVVATQISRAQVILLVPGGAPRSDFSLQMLVYAEPKIKVLEHSPSIELDEAVDDNGNILLPDPADVRPFYTGGGGIWNLNAQLHFPDHPGRLIAVLRGSTWFLIQTASERLEIPEILKARDTSRVLGGLPVTVGEMQKTGELYELHVAIARDPADPRWTQIQRFITQHLYVYDAAGQLMDRRATSSRSGAAQMEFTLSFAATGRPTGQPARLVWDVPTAAKTVRVPFEFKDLPMPR